MLYIRYPELIYIVNKSLHPLTNILHTSFSFLALECMLATLFSFKQKFKDELKIFTVFREIQLNILLIQYLFKVLGTIEPRIPPSIILLALCLYGPLQVFLSWEMNSVSYFRCSCGEQLHQVSYFPNFWIWGDIAFCKLLNSSTSDVLVDFDRSWIQSYWGKMGIYWFIILKNLDVTLAQSLIQEFSWIYQD